MSLNKKKRIQVILAGIAVAAGIMILSLNWLYRRALANYESPPEITIINASGTKLEDVVVSGSGYQVSFERLPEGAELTFDVNPTGESSLAIEFTANNRQYSDNDLAYIESRGGYWATLTITEEFAVDVDAGLRLFK
jgi:cytochrome c-type biogenesis protein CcmE